MANDGWISGVGIYNPGNGAPNYNRVFLIQGATVPEPASLAMCGLASLALVRRRRPV